MADPRLLDRAFELLMRSLVQRGRALHYAELALAMGLPVEEGRRLLLAVMQASHRMAASEQTTSHPSRPQQPTHAYRVTVRGEQREWFAQCGFEATSATWLFPGETVRVEAPCLDCGDPMIIEMRDGRFLTVDPPGLLGHLNYGFGPSRGRAPFL
jgi:hypothetical protein